MNQLPKGTTPRGKIAVRFIFTLLCMVILGAVQFIIQLTTIVQYIILFITKNHSEPLRDFANKAATYAYRLMRYCTLTENLIPFPFTAFPPAIEPPEQSVTFD